MPEKNKYYNTINTLIVAFLVIQVSTASVSIALSSIAFGTWGGLWIIQLIAFRDEPSAKVLWNEIKYIVLFLVLYAIADIAARIFAVFPMARS